MDYVRVLHERSISGGTKNSIVVQVKRHQSQIQQPRSTWSSDWDNMVDFYFAGESGEKLLTEMAETAENLQVGTEEDFFADILRDEIINLDEAVIMGSTANEVPTLESASRAIRVLPLRNVIDKQMASLLEERPSSEEKKGKESSGTESLSSCFLGLYSIKTVNRARWDVIIFICVVALIVMLFYLE